MTIFKTGKRHLPYNHSVQWTVPLQHCLFLAVTQQHMWHIEDTQCILVEWMFVEQTAFSYISPCLKVHWSGVSVRTWWKQNNTPGQVYILEVKTKKLYPNLEVVPYLRSCSRRATLGFHGHLTCSPFTRTGAQSHLTWLSNISYSTLRKVTRMSERVLRMGEGKRSLTSAKDLACVDSFNSHSWYMLASCLQVLKWRHSKATYLV